MKNNIKIRGFEMPHLFIRQDVVMLDVVVLSVIILNAVLLNVAMPKRPLICSQQVLNWMKIQIFNFFSKFF
jgi:hypothetical protein